MTDETTTEQLAEIEGQGEQESQPEPVQVREGRWRTRGGDIRNVTPTPEGDGRKCTFPWWDAQYRQTWTSDGRYYLNTTDQRDLIEYLGPIEPDKTQELPEYTPPEGWRVLPVGEVLQDGDKVVSNGKARPTLRAGRFVQNNQFYIRRIKSEPQAAAIEELRSEVSYVQNLLGTERRRVAELEELVTSLRTINEAQEKAFEAAGKENTALRNELAAVKTELASVAADRQRLRIELDAAQQVLADSPELRQLRADLAEVTRERDQYRHCYDVVSSHLETIEKTTKAETVEAIAEWLEPVQAAIAAADNVAESTRAGWLAEEVIQHLPKIMRNLVGLESPEDVD